MSNNILTPLSQEERDLTPSPKVECKILETNNLEKMERDIENNIKN